MNELPPLPPGFRVRRVTPDAAGDIAGVVNATMLAEIGVPWTTPERTRDELTAPDRDVEHDDVVVDTDDGEAVGYLQLEPAGDPVDEVSALVFVDPRWWGRGVSTWLLEVAERRTAEIVHAAGVSHVSLIAARALDNEPAARVLANLAFEPVRVFHMMRIDLDGAPTEVTVPEGLEIRTFDAGRDARPVYDALMEAFADHWGSEGWSFERWRHLEIDGEAADLDPTLWFLAVDGDEIAGVAICSASSPRDAETAVVKELAVRRPWRKRGLGLALLHTAFRTFAERGIPRAELGVDSESLTGATRLYARAGMTPAYSWEFWAKRVG